MFRFAFGLWALAVISVDAILVDEACTPSETKMDDCNTCFCLDGGMGYACTKLDCATAVVSRTTGEKVCESGDMKTEECNSCFCIADGTGYACTRKACPVSKATCEPGKSFKDYCNTCRCGTDGLRESAVCTKMACPANTWNQDGTMKHSGKNEASGPSLAAVRIG